MGEAIPVTLITGFLGSGKTTLLSQLLRHPALADTAVLINEFGEVGLDHLLVEPLDRDIVLLQSGCICCTVREDLAAAMRDLLSRRERGLIPPFRRLTIETTGLADPAPIVSTLLAEPVLRHHYRLGPIVATIDAVHGSGHLDTQAESVKQAAIADRLVLTKTDLALPAQVATLRKRLRNLNPAAALSEARAPDFAPWRLLAFDPAAADARQAEVRAWFEGRDEPPHHPEPGHLSEETHAAHIRSLSLRIDQPLDWVAFGLWLTMLLQAHGERVLRVKGLLRLQGSPDPVVLHAVQHVVHPPSHLAAWPDAERRSRLVFILRDLDPARLETSLRTFLAAGGPAAAATAIDGLAGHSGAGAD